jgi:hypothetical protein
VQHLISTNGTILETCRPKNLPWERYLKDCERAVNTSELQSDEFSSEDEGLANEEREGKKRPEHLAVSNSVIKVYNKRWRSSRVCK